MPRLPSTHLLSAAHPLSPRKHDASILLPHVQSPRRPTYCPRVGRYTFCSVEQSQLQNNVQLREPNARCPCSPLPCTPQVGKTNKTRIGFSPYGQPFPCRCPRPFICNSTSISSDTASSPLFTSCCNRKVHVSVRAGIRLTLPPICRTANDL